MEKVSYLECEVEKDEVQKLEIADEAAREEIKEMKNESENHSSNKSNPHGVTKEQVGLGNVPNVETNDQTPTYTAASTAAALSSGEKLSVAMGKIAKAISDLISHIANKKNPHGVTKLQIGLGNVENTYDYEKNVAYADNAGYANRASSDADDNDISSTYARIVDFEEHTGNKNNPHGVTKEQVGLGNVPNVTTNNQTPTYTESEYLSELKSGETLSTAMGKIARAVYEVTQLPNPERRHCVLRAGVTSTNFEVPKNARIDIYTSIYGVNPESAEFIEEDLLELTFAPQEVDLEVEVRWE